jgi:hypothetical protein
MTIADVLLWQNKTSTKWMLEAECRNMDTNLFFADYKNSYSKEAIDTCGRCKVVEDCLWYANESHSDFGYFAGMTPRARMKWRSENKVLLGDSREDHES